MLKALGGFAQTGGGGNNDVLSVNGQTGIVVLTAANVGAASNLVEIIAGTGLDGGGNLTANVTIDLANTAVTPGTYGNSDQIPVFTVDAQGRITSANTVSLSGTVVSVNGQTGVVVLNAANVGAASNTVEIIAGVGLDGGGNLSANVTIDLANTTVVAGVYGDAGNVSQVTIDAQGRITSANNVAIVASVPDPLSVNDFTAANVTINNSLTANLVSSNTAAMPDPSLPLNPEGYISVVINGSTKKIPYYGV